MPIRALSAIPEVDDLAALDGVIDHARVVGIGESAHNVHEFLTFRHRISRYLIEHKSFAAIAAESGLPEARLVDDYVTGKSNDIGVVATGLSYDFGRDTEVVEFIRWMRGYNDDAAHHRKIRFFGMDLASGAGSALPALDALLAFVDRADSSFARSIREHLRPLLLRFHTNNWAYTKPKYDSLPIAARDSFRLAGRHLLAHLNRRRLAYVKQTSEEAYELARRDASLLIQMDRFLQVSPRAPENPRDLAMAENVRWILEREGAGGKVIVWAHNAHVQKVGIIGPAAPLPSPARTVGQILAGRMHESYRAIGFAYGRFASDSGGPDPASIDAALSEVSGPQFLLDLGKARGPARRWLSEERLMRFQNGYLRLRPGAAFDAIVYLDRITPAVTTDTIR